MVGSLPENWSFAGGDVVGLATDGTLVEQGISVRHVVSGRCVGRATQAVYFRPDCGDHRGRAKTTHQGERRPLKRNDGRAIADRRD